MRLARFMAGCTTYDGAIEGEFAVAGDGRWPFTEVRLIAPCLPSKIIGVGRNYAGHAIELGKEVPNEPLIFLKAPSALNHTGGDIAYPRQSARVEYEGELAVVIGERCRDVARREALAVVRGYTVINDVTARDVQKSDGQWARAKGFDTFAPLGPWIETELDPASLRVSTYLNGRRKQDAPTSAMIFDVPALIEFISAAFTLEPGDVIATGTPSGVGPMVVGDEVSVEIAGIGRLTNRVIASR